MNSGVAAAPTEALQHVGSDASAVMTRDGRNPNDDGIFGTKSLVRWHFIQLTLVDGIS